MRIIHSRRSSRGNTHVEQADADSPTSELKQPNLLSHAHDHANDKLDLLVMEAGILFHSISTYLLHRPCTSTCDTNNPSHRPYPRRSRGLLLPHPLRGHHLPSNVRRSSAGHPHRCARKDTAVHKASHGTRVRAHHASRHGNRHRRPRLFQRE